MLNIEIIENSPALLINNKTLVMSDLHLGRLFIRDREMVMSILEYEISKVICLANKVRPKTIIFNGDMKESIGNPPLIVREYLEKLLEHLAPFVKEIIIIKGNHDGKIEEVLNKNRSFYQILIQNNVMEYNEKLIIGHGHKKISGKLINDAEIIISAHIHPALKIVNNGVKVKIWGLFEVGPDTLKSDEETLHKWLVMPAFSGMVEGMALDSIFNEELIRFSPFPNNWKIFKKRFMLLDITPIGDFS